MELFTDFELINLIKWIIIRFFVVDPSTENSIWIDKHASTGDDIRLIRGDPTGLYEMKAYTIEVSVLDNSINKDVTCFDHKEYMYKIFFMGWWYEDSFSSKCR